MKLSPEKKIALIAERLDVKLLDPEYFRCRLHAFPILTSVDLEMMLQGWACGACVGKKL